MNKIKNSTLEIGLAILAIALGSFLYFRQTTVFLGFQIPGYTGLILTFAGIVWLSYTLFSNK